AVRAAGRQRGCAAGRSPTARRYPGGMRRRAQRTPDVPEVTDPTADVPGAEGSAPRATSRRQLLRGAGAVAALGAVATAGAGGLAAARLSQPEADARTVIPLRSGTVAYDARGTRRPVGGRGERLDLSPGTRLAADLPETSPERRGTAAWRDGLAGSLPQAPLLHDLAASALQDLWILGDGLPAPVAGWSPSWRYLWPRDAAFCAVALVRVGHLDRAVEALAHLQSLQ